mgnify:FL=1
MNRRDFIQMTALFPLLAKVDFGGDARADVSAEPELERFVQVVRVLTGQMELSQELVRHVRDLLAADDSSFLKRAASLVDSIADPALERRDDIIRNLSDADVSVVTQIITPLYLGYTGTPANVKATDNARFVTFLQALMYEPTKDNLIRPSYSQHGANYWTRVPNGVSAPAMAENILEWGSRGPVASSGGYATPDPRYLAMCQGHARTVEEAEVYLASHGGEK